MNTRILSACRIPSLLLAAVLQFMPMVRATLPSVQTASNLFAVVFRWGAVAAAAFGGIQAVSGASTVITTGNITATNGVGSTNKLLTAPQTATYYAATGLPPGIILSGVNGSPSWKLLGIPTTTGVYNVGLTAKSSATAGASETTTKTIVFTVLAGGGGGGGNTPPVATAQSVTTAEDTAKAIALAGTDVDGNALTCAVITSPAHGTLSGTAPSLTYTPALNYNGADSFTFQANDGTTNSAPATVSITITPVNDAPVATAQGVATAEDTAQAVTLTGTDVDGNALTYAVVTQPTHGTLTGTAPSLTYTPALNYNGTDSFTFRANDGTTNSAAATVSITITAVNDAPVATAQSVATDKNVAKFITLAGSDVDGNALTFTVVTPPTKGVLSGTAPNLIYTPNLDVVGSDAFTFKANDSTVDSATATVSITIAAGPNTAPLATAQSVTTAEDTASAITLAGTDADGNTLTYTVVTQPTHGSLTGTPPNLTYTPALNYNGADSFTFRVNDGMTNSAAANVAITVTAVNDTPVASAQNVTTPEDTAKAVTLAGTDVDGNALTYTVATQPTHGTLSGPAQSLTYTPALNYNGADSFTFQANDGTTNSAPATVSITVTAVNDAPVASAQGVTTAEDTAQAVTLAGTDADGNALTYAVVTQPTHGTLSGTVPNLTYTPALNYNGADSFTFRVNDGTTNSSAATVSITVTPVNDAPVATAQSVTILQSVAKSITLAGSDVDGNAITFAVVTQPTQGVLSGIAPNLVYTPNANASGADSFTFKANDGTADSAAATVAITITTAANTAPVATAQSVTTAEDTAKAVTLTGTDVDGNALTYAVVTQPAHGTLSGTPPNLTYTPALNYNGADSFTFKANDGTVDSGPAAVSILVAAVNNAPVASAQSVTTAEDTAKVITLAGTDADGNALTYTIVTPPANGSLSGTPPNLTYSPATNFAGTDSFTFVANDGLADSAAATVTINVTAVAGLPTVSVTQTVNASEPARVGSFVLTRTGPVSKTLTVRFALDGTATPGVDFKKPGTNITFAIGKTNATVLITPVADTRFEGNKTVVLTLAETTNYFAGNPETAALTLGDDDRPKITLTTVAPVVTPALAAASSGPTDPFALKIKGSAITNYTQILQCSTNLLDWNVVAAPPTSAPTDYLEPNPTGMPQRFYRVLYVAGEVTADSIAEALTNLMMSANIVGAVNVQFQPGWNLAANPLNGYLTNGPVGTLPPKTLFQPFNSLTVNTYSGGKWTRGIPLTRSTPGGWLYNPATAPVNVTYVGTVPDPATQPSLPAGWCVRSSPVDVTVGDNTVLNYPLHPGDALYEYNPTGSSTNMWLTHLRGFTAWDTAPQLPAGQGVLIYKTTITKPTVIAAPKAPTVYIYKIKTP